MHSLFVFMYYFSYDSMLIMMAFFDIRFKKGKKAVCLLSVMGILMAMVLFMISINYFPTGEEPTPWWFYLSHILCIIPLIFWTEGNPVLNWLNFFIVGHLSGILLEFPIGVCSMLFFKNPHPIRCDSELSALPLIPVYFIMNMIEVALSIYIRSIWQKIISRKWLANTVFLISLIPMAVIIFWDFSTEGGRFQATYSVTKGILGPISLPVTLLVLLLILFQKDQSTFKKKFGMIEEESRKIFENHKNLTTLVQKTAILRHDIRNHLSVIENSINETPSENIEDIKHIFTLTDEILEKSKKLSFQEYTGHPVLDSLLSVKVQTAQKQLTDLEYHLSLPDDLSITDYDLVTLCSNLLDNALEAVSTLPENARIINFSVYEKKGNLCFYITNPYSTETRFSPPAKNRKEHGYGMRIINGIVQKYNGYIKMENELPKNGSFPTKCIFAAMRL